MWSVKGVIFSSPCLPAGRDALWLFMFCKRPRGQPVIAYGTQKGWEEIWRFSPGLGCLSAPNGRDKNGCGGQGIISVLEGTSGWFAGLPWGAATCSSPRAGLFFPSWAARREQALAFGGTVSVRGFPCSALPSSPAALPCLFLGLFTARRAISDGSPWTFVTNRDFLLCIWTSHSASSVTCRAGCPRAGGSLRIPVSAPVPVRCSQCPGTRGAAVGI